MSVKDRKQVIDALEQHRATLLAATREVERAQRLIQDEDVPNGSLSRDALMAFAEAAREVLGDEPLSVPAARRAGLLAAAGRAWENELGPMFTTAHVRELLGGVSRQRVDELLRKRQVIGLRDRDGRRRFPAFQFVDGKAQQPLVDAFWTVADAADSGWTAASWCVRDDEALDGRSPLRWVRDGGDGERLQTVARRDAARLGQ